VRHTALAETGSDRTSAKSGYGTLKMMALADAAEAQLKGSRWRDN